MKYTSNPANWIFDAKYELELARESMELSGDSCYQFVSDHAKAAAEKAVKGVIIKEGKASSLSDFSTKNVLELLYLVSSEEVFFKNFFQYGCFLEKASNNHRVNSDEANQAISYAEKIVEWCNEQVA